MQQSVKARSGRRLWPWLAAVGAGAALAGLNRRRSAQAVADNPPPGQFIKVGGASLHYVERGEGPPILLIHGNGVMVQDWLVSGLYDELAATHRVIAVDRPGFGHSSRPRGRRRTPEHQADLLAELLERLDAAPAIVVGHSFGALVAAAMAVRRPDLLKGAALIGGFYYPVPRADVVMVAGSAVPGWGDVVNHTVVPPLARAMRERINHKIFDPAPIPDKWREGFDWDKALRASRLRAAASDAGNMTPAARRLAPSYGGIDLPVAILAGHGDRMVRSEAQSERLHGDLPHSRLILFEEVGHMVHHNRMGEVAAAVRLL